MHDHGERRAHAIIILSVLFNQRRCCQYPGLIHTIWDCLMICACITDRQLQGTSWQLHGAEPGQFKAADTHMPA
jgi:hypothetical protein